MTSVGHVYGENCFTYRDVNGRTRIVEVKKAYPVPLEIHDQLHDGEWMVFRLGPYADIEAMLGIDNDATERDQKDH